MKFAMSNIAWNPEERIEAYHALVDSGVYGLEIAPGLFFHHADNPFEPDSVEIQLALKEIASIGLELVSMQSLLFGASGAALFNGANALDVFEGRMIQAIKLAGTLSIPNIVFGSPKQRVIPEGMSVEHAREHAANVFRNLGDVALLAETAIAIESNPAIYGTNFLNTLDEVTEFVTYVNHPAIVSILDLGAMHVNGEFSKIPKRLPLMLSKLNHVHVSEPELALAPQSSDQLAGVLSSLNTLGYTKSVSIEMRRPKTGMIGVKTSLKRLMSSAEKIGLKNE